MNSNSLTLQANPHNETQKIANQRLSKQTTKKNSK